MKSTTPPPLPLARYAGRYDQPLFGPEVIRLSPTGLELQMGDGQVAELDYHGDDDFYARWRDPLFREVYGTHITFIRAGDSVTSLHTRINRDEFTALKAGAPAQPNRDGPVRPPS